MSDGGSAVLQDVSLSPAELAAVGAAEPLPEGGEGAAEAGADVAGAGDTDLEVTVLDPKKHGEGGVLNSTYVLYTVCTKTSKETYSASEITVLRRYSDFLWLREQMVLEYQGNIIPKGFKFTVKSARVGNAIVAISAGVDAPRHMGWVDRSRMGGVYSLAVSVMRRADQGFSRDEIQAIENATLIKDLGAYLSAPT